MEVGFAKEHNVSNSTCSPTKSAPIDLIVADNKQEANECEHFTIRGYVAEARKKDIKLCWSFSMLHVCNELYKDADLLPPYWATKFRRWDCQKCRARIPSPESVLDGANRNTSNDKLELLEISLAASHPDASKNSSKFREILEKEMLEEGSTKAEHSICQPSLHFRKNENASAIAVINKEVCQTIKDGSNESEENRKQSNEYAFGSTECEAYQLGEHDERDNGVNATTSENVHGDNDSNVTSVKQKEIHGNLGAEMQEIVASKILKDDKELSGAGKIKESSDIVTEGYRIPTRVCLDIQNDDAVTPIAAKVPDKDSMGLDRDNQGVSDSHMCLKDVMAQIQNNTIHQQKLTRKLHSKRARKVRKLDDIIRNEKVCIYDTGNVLGGDAEVSKKSSDKKRDALEKRAHNLDTEIQLVDQKTAVNLGKRKFRNEVPRDEDGEHSLMHWLKKVPKQTICRNRDSETNCIDSAVGLSKFAADLSTWKDIHHEFEYHTSKEYKQKIILGREKNMMAHVTAGPTSPQDNMVGKGFNPEDLSTKHLNNKAAPFAPTKDTIPKKSRHNWLKVKDNTLQTNNLSNNNCNTDQVVERQSDQMNWPKESLSMHDTSGSQVHRKVTKKRRTMRSSVQEPMDDIPMDIVELLAKNLQEKRMMNAAGVTKNMWNLPQTADSIKDHYNTDVMNSHRNKESHAVYGNLTKQHSHSNVLRNSVHSTVKNNNSDSELKASDHPSIGKQNHCVDQYQRDQISASSSFMAFPEYDSSTSGMQIPVTGSYRSFLTQNFSWDKMKMQPEVLYHKDQLFSDRNSSRKECDRSCVLLNRATTETNGPKVGDKFDHVKTNSNGRLSKRKLRKVSHKTDCKKPIYTADDHLQYKKGKTKAPGNQEKPALISFVEAENGRHSDIAGQQNLYDNESKLALNLLKLMDWEMPSGQPHNAALKNQMGFIRDSELYHKERYRELHGLEVGARSTEIHKHPFISRHHDQDQLQRNCIKPQNSLTRMDIFGSSQKEIIIRSDSVRREKTGLNNKHLSRLKSLRIDEVGKTITPHSATHTEVPKLQPSSASKTSKSAMSTVYYVSYPKYSAPQDMSQAGLRNEDEALQHSRSNNTTETCAINRNPADFTTLDEDGEYMRGPEDRRHGYMPTSRSLRTMINQNCQKEKKLMKLCFEGPVRG